MAFMVPRLTARWLCCRLESDEGRQLARKHMDKLMEKVGNMLIYGNYSVTLNYKLFSNWKKAERADFAFSFSKGKRSSATNY